MHVHASVQKQGNHVHARTRANMYNMDRNDACVMMRIDKADKIHHLHKLFCLNCGLFRYL